MVEEVDEQEWTEFQEFQKFRKNNKSKADIDISEIASEEEDTDTNADVYECSECGHTENEKFKKCPSCGSRMKFD